MAKAAHTHPAAARSSKLHPTKNDLPPAVRVEMVELLNQRLADCIDLQTQCKQAHWNVKGPSFIALHKLFDEVNEAVEEYVDLLAERAVQLGGTARGTIGAVSENSSLAPYPLDISSGEDHAEALSSALAAFGRAVREAIDVAEKREDADTMDLFTEISRGNDQWLWFVEAHLERSGSRQK
jgi:starvation-inducible DNA-binding protein